MEGSKSVGTVDASVTKGSRGTHLGGIDRGVIPIRFRGGKEGRDGKPKERKKKKKKGSGLLHTTDRSGEILWCLKFCTFSNLLFTLAEEEAF